MRDLAGTKDAVRIVRASASVKPLSRSLAPLLTSTVTPVATLSGNNCSCTAHASVARMGTMYLSRTVTAMRSLPRLLGVCLRWSRQSRMALVVSNLASSCPTNSVSLTM